MFLSENQGCQGPDRDPGSFGIADCATSPMTCRTLYRGPVPMRSMVWVPHAGPVCGFEDGTIIMFGAHTPARAEQPDHDVQWEHVLPLAMSRAKRIAAVPLGLTGSMRCLKRLKKILPRCMRCSGVVRPLPPARPRPS